jgi:antitoxin component YwqK of YwqJK toxin-antitoxin module
LTTNYYRAWIWGMRKFALLASLVVTSICFAYKNADRPDLDDPEVRKKIIDDAIEFEIVKRADGSLQFFEPLELSPYRGNGWGALYYINRNVEALYQLKAGKLEGLKTGWYESGEKKSETNWKGGKLEGLSTFWHENGQKKEESDFKDGKPDGLSTFWHENGTKESEINTNNGKQDGLSTFWYGNGKKKSESTLKDGKLEGLTKEWHANGTKKSEINWKSGKQEGLSTFWHKNGQKIGEANWKSGKPDGLSTFWHENGTKKSEVNTKNGKPDGLSTSWYENGQRKVVFLCSEGKVVNGMGWLPNGQVCPISKIKDGSGVIVDYDNEGKEVSRKKFKEGFKANEVNEKTKTPFDSSIPLPNLGEEAFPAVFPK